MPIHVFRYDDFSACSSSEVEENLIGLFLKHRVPCTFAVVPYVCDPQSLLAGSEIRLQPITKSKADLLQPLLKASLAEIALHGYSHLTLAPVRGYQEFSQRMSGETQRQLLQRGRKCLEDVFDVKVKLYVPPWNNLAPSTVAALREEEFWLSGNIPDSADSEYCELRQMPCDTTIAQTSRALDTAQWLGGSNVVGTILHDYDFVESKLGVSKFTIPQFDELLASWKSRKNVEQRLISTVLQKDGMPSGRIRSNTNLKVSINRSRLRRKLLSRIKEVYWSVSAATRLAGLIKFLP